ncbi:molybdopterin biosynthesis protein [Candidatus Poribacteria bacterium]|nr:molybdopterin biosynthesis protein [Candidatus Poribacteria bacterium]
MRRKRYLNKLSLKEAQKLFLEHADVGIFNKTENLSPRESLGRITAEPVFARISSPHYHCSAMDGIAVLAEDTFGASTATPLRLSKEQFVIIDTGDPVPPDFNAVIMIEKVREVDENTIEILSAAAPWQYIRMAGEDIVATELILTRGHFIRPIDLAAMLSGGVQSVTVKKKPVVAVIPTGDEIVEPGEIPEPGTIIDSNSYMLEAMVKQWGGHPARTAIVEDDFEKITDIIKQAAADSDIVLTSAGSSAGRDDYIPPAIEELGELLVHGVSISPGKPTALGVVDGTPVLGLPGYPVSMAIAAESFLKPLMSKMLGISATGKQKVDAFITRKIPSKLGSEEYVRVKLSHTQDVVVATPLSRGASVLNSLVRADGIMKIPENSEGLMPDEMVKVELMRSAEDIKNSVVAIGSHDITLDILADEIKASHPEINFSSAHVGSLGGLMAIKRGEAHMAGTHLLDEETGDYNVSYIKRMLSDMELSLINLVYRTQGLIVTPGNPKNIKDLSDLVRDDVTFCNRQRGSGTRVLLDYQLKQAGILSNQVDGYAREVYTHMAVASAVTTGIADAGLGIYAAAKALGLDFIPISEERYDLIIPDKFIQNPSLAELLNIINESDNFRKRVLELGGYDTRDMGKVIM